MKSRKLRGAIARHCAALEFAMSMKESEGGHFHGSLSKFRRTIYEILNSDPIDKKFGKADVYDSAHIHLRNSSRAPSPRTKGKVTSRDAKGHRGKGTRSEENVTNGGGSILGR